jgi:hypothetical protein
VTARRAIRELVALVGRDDAAPIVREALASDAPSVYLAEYLGELWRAIAEADTMNTRRNTRPRVPQARK